MSAYQQIQAGQILLIVCCVFYLIWWGVSFQPGTEVNREGGYRGLLLLITAVCGIAGLVLSVIGLNEIPKSSEKLNGAAVAAAGIAAYIVLLLVTGRLLHRRVTTELVLITGWTVLELCVINSLNGAGRLSDPEFFVQCAVIAAAFAVGIVLYVLYYRMEEHRAFYAAMVPLIADGIAMGVLVFLMI
ncbi:MAG: hypothetical protein ACOX8B_02730 [Lachnospiraceae bacterium]|jgi:hypothetical protein